MNARVRQSNCLTRILGSLALAAVGFLWAVPREAAATHYPRGAQCYDCHAVSRDAKVTGTRLIRKSQATTDLAVTGGTPFKCLFCHRQGAVSVTSAVMKPVWDQFNAQSMSKHRANEQSSFVGDGTAGFDCLDCHTQQVNVGVVADGTGNASIHGADASLSVTTTNLPVAGTLIGMTGLTTYTDAQLSTTTCGSVTCHGGASITTYGPYGAPRQHSYIDASINNTPITTANRTCVSQCHGTHNSYDNDSLVVLREDGTAFNLPTTYGSPPVTPEKCGECHKQDDNTAVYAFGTLGHGKAGINLTCTNCHSPTAKHSFDYTGTNPLRFSLLVNTSAQSAIRLQPAYSPVFSICMTCHSGYSGLKHGRGSAYAGCNDCHEAHGSGAEILGTGGAITTTYPAQAKMVRAVIPKIGTNGTPLYGTGTTVGAWESNVFGTYMDGYRSDGRALCDNAECHAGRVISSTTVYPLSTFLLVAGAHTGGVTITTTSQAGFNCEQCHNHTDPAGAFAATVSCTNCHGMPPATQAHTAHVGAGFGSCVNCHPGNGKVNHNGAGIVDGPDYVAVWASNPARIRGQVQVDFTAVIYTSFQGLGTYTLAMTTTARTSLTTYGECSGAACHGGSISTTDRGTDTSPSWNVPSTGACGTCHKVTAAVGPASGWHALHVAPIGTGRGIPCQDCHYATTHDGLTITTSGSHVNAVNDVGATVGTYLNRPLNLAYTAPNCTAISCHGGYKPLSWTVGTTSCDNCHGLVVSTGGMATTVVAKHAASTWTIGSGFATEHTGIATGTAKECDYCHANRQTAYITTPGSDMHIDGKIQVNNQMSYLGTSWGLGTAAYGCASACHVSAAPYQMTETGYELQILTGQALNCSSCHGVAATGQTWPAVDTTSPGAYPNRAGEHQQHIDAIGNRMGWTTISTKNQTCVYCHPGSPYPIGTHNLNVGSGNYGSTADLFQDGVNTTGTYARIDGTTNGVTTLNMYNPATKSCTNVDCHYRSPTPAIGTYPVIGWQFGTANTATCTTCHGYVVAAGQYAGPILTNAHMQHVGTGASQKNYACTYCHPNWTTGLATTAHQSNQVNVVLGGTLGTSTAVSGTYVVGTTALTTTNVKFGLGTTNYGTCNNLYCHIQTTSPVWTAVITTAGGGACTACHIKGIVTTGVANNPSSGLHYGVTAPAVTGRFHDDTITTTTGPRCGYCHVSVQPLASHVNGMFESGAGQTAQMSLATFYTQTADGVGSCQGGTLGSTGCHDGGGDQGSWARKWDRSISYAVFTAGDYTSCAGCHGGFGTIFDWTFGSGAHNAADNNVEHGFPWATGTGASGVIGNHSSGTLQARCDACHAYPQGVYTTLGAWAAGVSTGAGYHGNNQIELNASDGYTRTAITTTPAYGCQINCHTINTGHNLEGSGWVLDLVTGPPGGCSGCHGNGATGQWWPALDTTSGGYPNRMGEHQQHVDAIANRAGGGTTSVAFRNQTCNYCHPGSPYPMGVHNLNLGTTGTWGTTADLYQDGVNTTGTYARIDGSANGVTTLNMYSPATKSCTNVDCHYRSPTPGAGAYPVIGWLFGTANTATCTTCHGYIMTAGQYAGPILTNAHMQHVGTGASQKNYACTYCHPNWTTGLYTTAHQSNQVNVVLGGTLGTSTAVSGTYVVGTGTITTTNVKYGLGTTNYGTCNNLYCHIQTTSPVWTATITTAGGGACTACHIKGIVTTGVANNPSSGLHYGVTAPAVTGRFHDDTITTTTGPRCGYCHVSVQPLASHVNGMFESGAGQTAQMSLATFYTQTADGVGSCQGGTLGSTGCHDGGGDQGSWARKWDRSISYAVFTAGDYTSCAGCHGGFGTTFDWTFGSGAHNAADNNVEHGFPWATGTGASGVIGNHSSGTLQARCDACHAYPQGVYTTLGAWAAGVSTGAGYHGNNQIELNASDGYTRTAITTTPAYGCQINCHTINTGHNLEGSGWVLDLVTGPPGGCSGCHGNGATGQWWPALDTTSGGYPNRMGEHQQHVDAIANRAGGGTTSVAFRNQTCNYCHPGSPYPMGVHNLNLGTTGTWGTTADLYQDGVNTTGTYARIDGSANGVTTLNMYSPATKSCTNVDCHYRSPTPGAGAYPVIGWLFGTANTATCTTCHGYIMTAGQYAGPILTNAHMQHVGTGASQKNYACTYCHPNWTTGLYTTAHQSNQVNVVLGGTLGTSTAVSGTYVVGTGTITTTNVKYGLGTTNYGTCNNLYCHIQTTSPVWTAVITTAGGGACTACHIKGIVTTGVANNPSSGLHYGVTAPAVTGRFHDDTITTAGGAGCTFCHAGIGPRPNHVDGNFDDGFGTTFVTNMGLGTFYSQVATGVGSCYGAGGALGTTGCHDGVGDQGSWARKWDRTISYVVPTAGNYTACRGCHGGFQASYDWTFGSGAHNATDGNVEHGFSWDGDGFAEVIDYHRDSNGPTRCNICHVYADAPYSGIGTWAAGVTTGAGYHGNNQIEMNGTLGYTRVTTGTVPAYGCASTCHFSAQLNTGHNLEGSGWALNLVTGPALQCNSCHGGSSGEWWPVQTFGSYPDRAGQHLRHIVPIYNLNTATLVGSTNIDKMNQTCNWCHPGVGTTGHDQNTAGTDPRTADLYLDGMNTLGAGNYRNILGSTNLISGAYVSTLKACDNVDCHYRTRSPSNGTYPDIGWLSTSPAGGCASCHGYSENFAGFMSYYGPLLPNAHMQHVGTGATEKAYSCASCHVTPGANPAHENNRVELTVGIYTGWAYVTGTSTITTVTSVKYGGLTTTAAGTCNNLYCHIRTASPTWVSTIGLARDGGCTQCHITGITTAGTRNPSSGLHYGTTGPTVSGRMHDDTITSTTGQRCGYCHVNLGLATSHVNGSFDSGVGTANLAAMGLATFYTQVATGVGNCSGGSLGSTGCHDGGGDQGSWARKWDRSISYAPPITSGSYATCAGCHGGFGTTYDWTFGSGAHLTTDGNVEHGYPWATGIGSGKVIGNHSDATLPGRCDLCHAYPQGVYTTLGNWAAGVSTGAGFHGNNQIEMNASSGYTRQGTTTPSTPGYGCTGNCHSPSNASHNLENSGWVLNLITGPAGGCDACHGFPPIGTGQAAPVARTGAPKEKLEDYPNGGGAHRVHVNFLWRKLDPAYDPSVVAATPTSADARVLCGPCHGDTPGTAAWHRNAGVSSISQTEIDLRVRTTSGGYRWGTAARYNGTGAGSADLSQYIVIVTSNKAGGGNNLQECRNLDCHGRPDPAKQVIFGGSQSRDTENQRAHMGTVGESLRWTDTYARTTHDPSYPAKYRVTMRTAVCKWCHDETPAQLEVWDANGTARLYTSTGTPDAAAAYFRPLSGYSRGGHGDGNINASDDPSFPTYDPAIGSTAMDCTACHDDRRNADTTPFVGHFGTTPTNLHRLGTTTTLIEDQSHSGLCNNCHLSATYPTQHHPSYYMNSYSRFVIVTSGQEINSTVPAGGATWYEIATGSGRWQQNAYGAASFSGNPDRFLNWWAGNYGVAADPPPAPVWYGEAASNSAARALLPTEQYVGGGAVTDRVMCVTCHNPHGTDLMTYDVTTSGDVRQIPDNNMLRLRDTDNTLCAACH